MLTGAHFDAGRAYEVGMVNKVVPQGEHVRAAMEYARVLVRSAPLVVEMLKGFVGDTVLPKGPAELSAMARRELLGVHRSADRQEGARAFVGKREPVFSGQ